MTNFETNLKKLRDVYTLPKNREKLTKIEKRIRKAIFNQKLQNNEVIKMIIKDAEDDIKAIDALLAYDEELNKPGSEYKRALLFEKRNWLLHDIIDRFSMEREKRIQEKLEGDLVRRVERLAVK